MSHAPDEAIRDATGKLGALRDEMRLKVHLAGLEARGRWEEEVSPKLEALQKGLKANLRRGADEARVQLHLGLAELNGKWGALEPRLRELVEHIRAAGRAQEGGRLSELIQSAKDAIDRATG